VTGEVYKRAAVRRGFINKRAARIVAASLQHTFFRELAMTRQATTLAIVLGMIIGNTVYPRFAAVGAAGIKPLALAALLFAWLILGGGAINAAVSEVFG
jgi:uncharacterized membrane protein YadS